MVKPEMTGDFATLMGWADAVRRMKVRANAETPADARVARSFGAEGIGLCRTEHMFFDGERIVAVREMILADTEQGRRAALAKLLPMQRQDFAELFEIMTGLPVTIRLLDPPLHEFLPKTDEEIEEVAKAMKVSAEKLRARAAELHEFNPMLGFRGVRLAIRYPEIAEMQARAIFEGAVEAGRKTGAPVTAEIMVPLVIGRPELDAVKAIIVAMAETVAKETGVKVPYHVGTMIELPRAALRAGDIAKSAEFFSFGTNDLTQTTLGVSRDDAASFLGTYTVKGLLEDRSVRDPRHRRRRRTDHHRLRARQGDAPRHQARRLRRTRRRSGLDRLLRRGASRLRLLLPLPHPHRPPRRRAGGAGHGRRRARREGGVIVRGLRPCVGLRQRAPCSARYVGSSLIAVQKARTRETVKVGLSARPALTAERASSSRPRCARATANAKYAGG